MNHPSINDQPTTDIESDDCLSHTSILDWIKEAHTSTPTPSTSQPSASLQVSQASPTLITKRRRSSDSLPSVFLGDRPSLRKRRRILEAMAANMSPPMTPGSKGTLADSGASDTPAIKDTPRKAVESLKDLKNADTLGEMMSNNGLMFNDKVAFDKYPHFKDKVMEIIRVSRDSVMQPSSHKKFDAYLDEWARFNEATFLRKIFPLLMKDGLHLRREEGLTEEQDALFKKAEYSRYRDFLMDEGISEVDDRQFLQTLVPSSCNKDCELYMAKVLAKITGMTNPKPDYAFGIQRNQFARGSDVMLPEYINALLNIAPGIRHAFLIVEGKPYDGVKADAENQARRGGATLVHADRLLRAEVQDASDIEDPDEESFVFSVIIDPAVVEFWVHWFEGKGLEQFGVFHMNRLASRTLVEEDQREDIRRKMHNIMEWGGVQGLRFQERKKLHESIDAFARAEQEKTLAKGAKTSPRKRPRTENSSTDKSGGNDLPDVNGGSGCRRLG